MCKNSILAVGLALPVPSILNITCLCYTEPVIADADKK